MPRGIGPRLRFLLVLFHGAVDPVAAAFPGIAEALERLEAEVVTAFPEGPRGKGRPMNTPEKQIKRLRNQKAFLVRQKRKLEEELKCFRTAKSGRKDGQSNRMTPAFLAKVVLSLPSTCARAFATAWQDLVGVGSSGCSRPTISKIRSAFVEVVKTLTGEAAGRAAAKEVSRASTAAAAFSSSAASGEGGSWSGFATVALLHVHDEAFLRLRSNADGTSGVQDRSRGSKVQQHVCSLHFPQQQPMRWYTELDPLSNKTALVLATSLYKVLSAVTAALAPSFADSSAGLARPWLTHILLGDGLSTNQAAARRVLAHVRRHGLAAGFRYLLMVIKCCNHQVNLGIGSAVEGRAVGAATECSRSFRTLSPQQQALARKSDSAHHIATGAIVRLFKYLVSDYEADFVANLSDLVHTLRRAEPSPQRSQALLQWKNLEILYGGSVFPPGLLSFLNGGLGDWSTDLTAALAPTATGPTTSVDPLSQVRDGLLLLLRRRVLVVDEKPTLSRMFTFKGHLDCCLLLHFLDIVQALFRLRGNPRAQSQRRLAKVQSFFRREDTGQYLRRTSLAGTLLDHVQRFCAQEHVDGPPLLVRISRGGVSEIISTDLFVLLSKLHLDPGLDLEPTVCLLLSAAVEVVIRFREYRQWPYSAWALCRVYNPDQYMLACAEFLELPSNKLDVGFGLQLRHLAEKHGHCRVTRLQWLLSPAVQEAIVTAFEASGVSSLPAERAFASTKRSEAPRLCHVATASRNSILRCFLRERQALVHQAEVAAAVMRRSLHSSITSLAWEWKPELADMSLSGEGVAPTRAFVSEHRDQLQAELHRRRQVAREAVQAAQSHEVPFTTASWEQWFRWNEDHFYRLMADSGPARRLANRRLQGDPAFNISEPRIMPVPTPPAAGDTAEWRHLLRGRTGWHLIRLHDGAPKTVWTCVFWGHTWVLDFSPWKKGKYVCLEAGCCPDLDNYLVDLDLFARDEPVFQVFSLEVTFVPRSSRSALAAALDEDAVSPSSGQLHIRFTNPTLILEALPRVRHPRAPRRRPQGSEGESGSSSAEDSEEEIHRISSSDSAASVDTDLDDGVDDEVADVVAGDGHKAGDKEEDFSDEEEDVDVGEDDVAAAEGADLAIVPLRRHPPGTWKIQESTWFYMTKTPGFFDVKVWLKTPFRCMSGEGMGVTHMSRTLTPHHYGDSWEDPWRTIFLLRAWTIWRARWLGWSRAKECRHREVCRQLDRFVADLKQAHVEHGLPLRNPLLGNALAHKFLLQWTADAVQTLLS